MEATLLLFLPVCLFAMIVAYYNHRYKYWEKRGVLSLKSSIPLGNTNTIFPKGLSVGPLSKKFYDEFKRRGHKFGGVYLVTEPNLVLVDPEYVKDVLHKDFHYFTERGFYFNPKDDPVSANLVNIKGPQWKDLRRRLTPTFTSSKMKTMFQGMVRCSKNMIEAMEGEKVDVKEILGRFTTDVIGSCAFGIDCNSFENPDAEFRQMGIKITHFGFWRTFRLFIMLYFPKFSLKLGLGNNTKETTAFFRKIVQDTIAIRKELHIRRNDFLQILMDMEEEANFTLDEITAQAYIFFLAGFETSSATMTFCFYELAKNVDVQERLYEEVRKQESSITYETLAEIKYLEQVLEETLRKYPPFPTLNRRCTKDYILKDTNIKIEIGTPILVSTLGLHMDPEYYPDPEKFSPGRFNEEEKKERPPFVYLPFGGGPRNCIAARFGRMQSKIGIAAVVKNFKIFLSPEAEKTQFDPTSNLLNTIDKIYLRIERRM